VVRQSVAVHGAVAKRQWTRSIHRIGGPVASTHSGLLFRGLLTRWDTGTTMRKLSRAGLRRSATAAGSVTVRSSQRSHPDRGTMTGMRSWNCRMNFDADVVRTAHACAIRLLLDNRGLRGAIILIYAGMDAMAFLDMPADQDEVSAVDFVRWADRYVRFRCAEQLSGDELYGARCAALHAYGTESRRSKSGAIRQIGYMDQSEPPILSKASVPGLVLVAVPALGEAFFSAVDQFLIDLFKDQARASIAEARFRKIMHELPLSEPPVGR
jgi:hypothetical protein